MDMQAVCLHTGSTITSAEKYAVISFLHSNLSPGVPKARTNDKQVIDRTALLSKLE